MPVGPGKLIGIIAMFGRKKKGAPIKRVRSHTGKSRCGKGVDFRWGEKGKKTGAIKSKTFSNTKGT